MKIEELEILGDDVLAGLAIEHSAKCSECSANIREIIKSTLNHGRGLVDEAETIHPAAFLLGLVANSILIMRDSHSDRFMEELFMREINKILDRPLEEIDIKLRERFSEETSTGPTH